GPEPAARRGRARDRRGDGAHGRRRPRAADPRAPLRSAARARRRRRGRRDHGPPPRLERGAHRRRDRPLPPPRGEPEELRMSKSGSKIGAALAEALGADRVAEDAATLDAHRLDYWFLGHLRAFQGRGGAGPVCVVTPRSTDEVATTVRLAQRHGVAIVPFGGGSGVLGGSVPPDGTIVVDIRAMDRLLTLDETALFARVQAGMMGGVYEETI